MKKGEELRKKIRKTLEYPVGRPPRGAGASTGVKCCFRSHSFAGNTGFSWHQRSRMPLALQRGFPAVPQAERERHFMPVPASALALKLINL